MDVLLRGPAAQLEEVTEEDIRRGMERMRWQGRMETVLPGVILDGAHNDSGVEEFVKTARRFQKDGKVTLLFSCVKEKDYEGMIRTICENLELSGVSISSPRTTFPCSSNPNSNFVSQ